MGEAVDYEAINEKNDRLTNLALANAHILLAMVRLNPKSAYDLFHVLETCAEAGNSVELNVRMSGFLEEAGIELKDIENIWEMLEIEEGKLSIIEFFNSSGVVRGLIKNFREGAWQVVEGMYSSNMPWLDTASNLNFALSISEVCNVLSYFEGKTKAEDLNPRIFALIENIKSTFSIEEIQGIFEYIRYQLLHQTNEEN